MQVKLSGGDNGGETIEWGPDGVLPAPDGRAFMDLDGSRYALTASTDDGGEVIATFVGVVGG